MKRSLLSGMAFLALTVTASAADLPPAFKARAFDLPTVICTPSQCSGFYAGFNISGIGTSLDVLGSGINGSLFAAGFGIGGQAGYQFWNGSYFFAAEVAADYMTNSPAAPGAAATDTGKFRTTELAKAGIGLASLFGSAPGAPAPSQGPLLPGNLLANLTSPYVILGVGQKSGSNAFVSGAGVQAALAAGWNMSVEYQNWHYDKTAITPLVSQATENVMSVKLNRMF